MYVYPVDVLSKKFKTVYIGNDSLIGYQHNSSNLYKNYIKSPSDYKKQIAYYFGDYCYLSDFGDFYCGINIQKKIKIAVFDDVGKYEIQYFDF